MLHVVGPGQGEAFFIEAPASWSASMANVLMGVLLEEALEGTCMNAL